MASAPRSTRPHSRNFWLALTFVAVVTFGAYAYALGLPFFSDDVLHFRWLQTRDVSDIWLSAALLGYYRPFPTMIWKVLWHLQGGYNAPALHAVNLLSHVVNAVLVMMLLIWRSQLQRQPHHSPAVLIRAAAGAMLFALYPFSYQAVPWMGAVGHPLVLTAILAALLSAWVAEQRGSWVWRGVSLGFTLIAPFIHETGLLIAPSLGLTFATSEASLTSWREALRLTRWHWLCTAVGLSVSLVMRQTIGGAVGTSINLESRYQNAVYFLQGLAYVVAPLAKPLRALNGDLDDMRSVILVCLPAVLAITALCWRMGGRRVVLLALGWFVLCVFPAWLLLGFDYVVDGPRLLYQASVGAAIFWSAPLYLTWPSTIRLAGRAAAWLPAIAALLIGGVFLFDRARMHEQGGRATLQLAESAITVDPAKPVMVVNFPKWIAPRDSTFAVGHEGVTFVPNYGYMGDYVWANTQREQVIDAVAFPDLRREWQFVYASAGEARSSDDLQNRMRGVSKVIFTDVFGSNLWAYDAGGLQAVGAPPANQYIALLDGRLALITGTYKLEGSRVVVQLQWQSQDKLDQETKTFVHIQAADETLVAQTDGFPVANLSRPFKWQEGDVWRDERIVSLPFGLTPGEYVLRVGAYPASGGDRLRATDMDGQRFDNDSVTIATIRIS